MTSVARDGAAAADGVLAQSLQQVKRLSVPDTWLQGSRSLPSQSPPPCVDGPVAIETATKLEDPTRRKQKGRRKRYDSTSQGNGI